MLSGSGHKQQWAVGARRVVLQEPREAKKKFLETYIARILYPRRWPLLMNQKPARCVCFKPALTSGSQSSRAPSSMIMLKRRFKHYRITKFMRSVSMQIEFMAGAFENPVIGERTQQFIMAGSWLVGT